MVGRDRAVLTGVLGDRPDPDPDLGPTPDLGLGPAANLGVEIGVLALLIGVGTYGDRTGSGSSIFAYTNPLKGFVLVVTNGPDRAKGLL